MLSDFTIMIDDVTKPMGVRVVVHKNLGAMRSACTQTDRILSSRKKRKVNQFKDTMGICQRFHMADSPIYSVVRFAVPHVGAGMVAHEMAHAAVWLWAIKNQFREDVPLACDNDEWFAWILGELVRQTTNKFIEDGIYTKENSRKIHLL